MYCEECGMQLGDGCPKWCNTKKPGYVSFVDTVRKNLDERTQQVAKLELQNEELKKSLKQEAAITFDMDANKAKIKALELQVDELRKWAEEGKAQALAELQRGRPDDKDVGRHQLFARGSVFGALLAKLTIPEKRNCVGGCRCKGKCEYALTGGAKVCAVCGCVNQTFP